MASLRPSLYSPGVYNTVVQSNPRSDMYKNGMLSDQVSAAYRRRQKRAITQHPAIDVIHSPMLNPIMTPSASSMIGAGKNKKKVRSPYAIGNASKLLAFFTEAGISAKKAPKMVKGTLAKMGPISFSREPTYNSKIGRYIK